MLKPQAIWNKLSHYGCHHGQPEPEQKRIRLANQSSLILAGLICLYASVFAMTKHPILAWITLIVALLFALVPSLQSLSSGHIWSRYWILGLNYLSILIYSLAIGPDSGIHLFFISAIATPFALIEIKSRLRIAVFALIPILALIFLETFGFSYVTPVELPKAVLRSIYLLVLPTACIMTFLFSGYFYVLNRESEEKLHHTIQDLNHSQQMIEDQKIQLASASRLAAIGELSGSIAHEINNPLAIIQGYTEQLMRLLQAEALDRDRIKQTCGKILSTVDRITKIIYGLRKLSREGVDDPTELANLATVVEDATSVCMESLHHLGIDLRITFPDQACQSYCRALQISQVLLNLIQNSKDAISELTVKWIEIEVRAGEQFNEIIVKDSGKITSKDTIAKMGQPFFTTKASGKGTGLGLSISKKILAAHEGHLLLDKTQATTTFVLQLPRKSPAGIHTPAAIKA